MKLRFLIFAFIIGMVAPVQIALAQSNATDSQIHQTITSSGAKVSWSKTVIDSTFNPTCCDRLKTSEIVAKYKPTVDSYGATIAVCPKGLERGDIETQLGDWSVDVLYDYARKYLDTTGRSSTPLDFSIMNFGGMRTEMPKGEVNSLDILSIFPFDNYLVIIELPGKNVNQLFEFLSKTRIQPMSHVKFAVKNNQITECLINGEPVDENRTYYIATIDFLMNGGDGLVALGRNVGVIETHIKMMDLFLTSIKDITAQGKVIEKELDGRASWE